jgi:hypothetical protein
MTNAQRAGLDRAKPSKNRARNFTNAGFVPPGALRFCDDKRAARNLHAAFADSASDGAPTATPGVRGTSGSPAPKDRATPFINETRVAGDITGETRETPRPLARKRKTPQVKNRGVSHAPEQVGFVADRP